MRPSAPRLQDQVGAVEVEVVKAHLAEKSDHHDSVTSAARA
jgi:hypothetical protein